MLSKLANSTNEDFNLYKESIQNIENDLLLMMKNYKDLLNTTFGMELVKQDIDHIKQFLSSKEFNGVK